MFTSRLADILSPDREGRVTVLEGTVATVTPGGAVGGVEAAVTVTIGVDVLPAMYLDSYTPTVGDLVELLLVDGSPRILGRLAGAPII